MQEYKLNVSIRKSEAESLQTSYDKYGVPIYTNVYSYDKVMHIDATLSKPIIKDRLIDTMTSDNCKFMSEKLRSFADKKLRLENKEKNYMTYTQITLFYD